MIAANSNPEVRATATAIAVEVIAQARFRADLADLAALRKAPGPPGDPPPSPGLLRHADEQSVVGLAALLRAARGCDPGPAGFGDWSILSAPRHLGRAAFLASFPLFMAEGAWGISPHLIASHSLHSPSGTYSQVLGAHGPNLGVGGTPGPEPEAFLAAATLLGAGMAPGVWVVFTGPTDPDTSNISPPGAYEAFAVALVPAGALPLVDRPRLTIRPGLVQLVGPGGSAEDRADLIARAGVTEGPGRVDPGQGTSTIPAPHFFAPKGLRAGADRDPS